ncbi:T-lymphocyte surface antigen Ly-9 [Chelonia mydas]|uniref:T-lymphocyte surface antigen Ly-9 n=1 Tax=Chelonia mydas TaxID=8469 RepID=M7B0K8_CHEMY|nr:T-lymphocyte surface antigen Ly-9 [Chelonia mydas]
MAPKERSVWWVWISVLCAGTVARAAEQGQSSKDTGQSGHLGGTASYFTWTAERTDRNATWITTNTATSAEGGPTTPNTTVLIPVKDTTGRKITGQLSKPEIAIHSVKGICNVTLTCTMREGGGDITYVWHQPGKSHVLSTEPILRITQKPADGFLNYTCTIHNTESKSSSMVSLSKHCNGASASSLIKYWVPLVFMVIALITLYFTYRKTTERAQCFVFQTLIHKTIKRFTVQPKLTPIRRAPSLLTLPDRVRGGRAVLRQIRPEPSSSHTELLPCPESVPKSSQADSKRGRVLLLLLKLERHVSKAAVGCIGSQ